MMVLLFKEVCPVCNCPTDEHDIEKLLECIDNHLKSLKDTFKKLPHYEEKI